ncbi:MAG: hypothetical protein MH472_03255 [Bacteroidia bacterium]|nr:hypothetical protein [Bacteroidia bacterium]
MNVFKILLVFGLMVICSNKITAQESIKPEQLFVGDSVSLQTTNGIFNYGFYVKHNDSVLFLSYQRTLLEPKEFKISKIAEITLLKREVVAAIEPEIQALDSTQNRAPIKTTKVQDEIDSIEDYERNKVTAARKFGQVAAGSAVGYAGFVVGLFAGAGVGYLVNPTGGSNLEIILYSIVGGALTSVAASSYTIYRIGNTIKYKGSFQYTFAGTMIGFVTGVIVYPFAPIIAATGGTIAYNLTRKKVK